MYSMRMLSNCCRRSTRSDDWTTHLYPKPTLASRWVRQQHLTIVFVRRGANMLAAQWLACVVTWGSQLHSSSRCRLGKRRNTLSLRICCCKNLKAVKHWNLVHFRYKHVIAWTARLSASGNPSFPFSASGFVCGVVVTLAPIIAAGLLWTPFYRIGSWLLLGSIRLTPFAIYNHLGH